MRVGIPCRLFKVRDMYEFGHWFWVHVLQTWRKFGRFGLPEAWRISTHLIGCSVATLKTKSNLAWGYLRSVAVDAKLNLLNQAGL